MTENLWVTLVPGRNYELEVTAGDGQKDGIEVQYHSDPLNPNKTAAIPHVSALNPLIFGLGVLALRFGRLMTTGLFKRRHRRAVNETH